MRFSFKPIRATFVSRPNRFHVRVRLHDDLGVASEQEVSAHCADPGRLRELLIPGVTVYVSPAATSGRKTAYDLRFVEHPQNGQLVSLDPRLPNRLFMEGLQEGFFTPFRDHMSARKEVSVPHSAGASIRSRIDFQLTDREGWTCWVEVKSATLVEDGQALFPDAPTERGCRHVMELAELIRETEARAAAVFIIQRPDAHLLRPNRETDPDFADALVSAQAAGLEIYAYTCNLTLHEVALLGPVPVIL